MPKQPSDYLNLSFRAGDLAPDILARSDGSANQAAQEQLRRYFALLRRALLNVRLMMPEALLLMDARNGILTQPEMMPFLAAGVEDAIHLHRLDQRYGIDGPMLIAKLKTLGLAETVALVDAIERAWNLSEGSAEERLRTVGVIRPLYEGADK